MHCDKLEDDQEKRKLRTYSCERKGLNWIRLTRLLHHEFTATAVCLNFIVTHINSFFFPHQPRGSALDLGWIHKSRSQPSNLPTFC